MSNLDTRTMRVPPIPENHIKNATKAMSVFEKAATRQQERYKENAAAAAFNKITRASNPNYNPLLSTINKLDKHEQKIQQKKDKEKKRRQIIIKQIQKIKQKKR